MRHLSKSKIIAYRQCPKRLWLEVHRRELRDDSGAQAVFAIGHEVGDVARQVYDENGNGVFLDLDEIGFAEIFAQSTELLAAGQAPVFEAGFRGGGGLAFADVMLPDGNGTSLRWHMIEVKSSTSVKDYHRDDVAVQSCIASAAGIELASVALAHIDNTFVYPGGGDYGGLFHEEDLTEEALARREEVATWIQEAQVIAARQEEPVIDTGSHCSDPFDCPFLAYCNRGKAEVEYPLTSLPRFRATAREQLESEGVVDLRDVPDEALNDQQLRVKTASVSGEIWFDREGASADLAPHGFPAWFLDFETVSFPVPVWTGTRPYQQLPFQYSLHRVDASGELSHEAFLDLTGEDPGEAFARTLVDQCGDTGPVFVYNASFERGVMSKLAERFPKHASGLEGIIDRLVDLLPVARNRYYHPDQHGSWSIKAVLPCLVPDLSYGDLEGVADGNMASTAFREAIAESTTEERRKEIEQELLAYCHLDTLAMVRMWEEFRGDGES
jgi:CRISPR/Cas system-associated exonuclease Cas4 (RecB family)